MKTAGSSRDSSSETSIVRRSESLSKIFMTMVKQLDTCFCNKDEGILNLRVTTAIRLGRRQLREERSLFEFVEDE